MYGWMFKPTQPSRFARASHAKIESASFSPSPLTTRELPCDHPGSRSTRSSRRRLLPPPPLPVRRRPPPPPLPVGRPFPSASASSPLPICRRPPPPPLPVRRPFPSAASSHPPATARRRLYLSRTLDIRLFVPLRISPRYCSMAARRNVRYSALPTEDKEDNNLTEDNVDLRFTYTPKSLRKIPWKSIALALFLLLLGSSLLFLSYFIFTGHMEGDSSQAYGLLFLGFLAFLPGFYETRVAYYSWRGAQGYTFASIPDY